MKKKIIIFLIVVLAGIQFIRIDKTNPKTEPKNNFFSLSSPSEEISKTIKTSCFDCHSNETIYPWYSNIAPVSWLLKNHINEGREHLNFSEWGKYSISKKSSLKEDMTEEINSDDMPLSMYTLLHSEAKLSTEQKNTLVNWLKEVKSEK